jgi:hypothetical protein
LTRGLWPPQLLCFQQLPQIKLFWDFGLFESRNFAVFNNLQGLVFGAIPQNLKNKIAFTHPLTPYKVGTTLADNQPTR